MVVLPSTLADVILYHCFSVGYYTNEIDPSYNSHNWNFRAAFVQGLIGKNRELPVQAETRDLVCRGASKHIRATIDTSEIVLAKELIDQSSQDLRIYRCD